MIEEGQEKLEYIVFNEEDSEEEEPKDESSVNIPIDGSPLYPHTFFGESGRPLNNLWEQFPESEYVGDNINTTNMGLMSGVFGQERIMSDSLIITEYKEDNVKKAISATPPLFQDHGLVIEFEESPEVPSLSGPGVQVLEVGGGEGPMPAIGDESDYDVVEYEEELSNDDIEDILKEVSDGDAEKIDSGLPGALYYVEEVEEENEDDDEPEKETDWEHDRDPAGFMVYITKMYPGGIPEHDGTSISGCEKAIHFINNQHKQISEAIRSDKDGVLDIGILEDMRVNMIKDVRKLKNHANDLKKKHKKGSESHDMIKEATTPRIQLVMTPFERAITGMLINSVVSAGKPFEDVYDYLKKKYAFTPREELAIMQLAMDMGQPIFKDRGTIGGTPVDGSDAQGVDFIKNYFG